MDDRPRPRVTNRALVREERGAALDVREAAALLAASGKELDRLTIAAARVRDAGLVAARTTTYGFPARRASQDVAPTGERRGQEVDRRGSAVR